MSHKSTAGGRPAKPGPHHPLDEVKRLVTAGKFSLSRTRAQDFLIPPRTLREARRYVAAALQSLSVENFEKSMQLRDDMSDVYGLNVDGTGWYIKLCIDDQGEVDVISFHPPEHPIRTRAGTITPP